MAGGIRSPEPFARKYRSTQSCVSSWPTVPMFRPQKTFPRSRSAREIASTSMRKDFSLSPSMSAYLWSSARKGIRTKASSLMSPEESRSGCPRGFGAFWAVRVPLVRSAVRSARGHRGAEQPAIPPGERFAVIMGFVSLSEDSIGVDGTAGLRSKATRRDTDPSSQDARNT